MSIFIFPPDGLCALIIPKQSHISAKIYKIYRWCGVAVSEDTSQESKGQSRQSHQAPNKIYSEHLKPKIDKDRDHTAALSMR